MVGNAKDRACDPLKLKTVGSKPPFIFDLNPFNFLAHPLFDIVSDCIPTAQSRDKITEPFSAIE